ncbi:MAG: hypothetical protein U0793_12760 [Gemmataceae bacterium]
MATRPVRFELHIRPLIRVIDREGMAWAFDLWDYDDVKAHADQILHRTAVDMPPTAYGGPWPAEWVALFQRWKDEGFLRLDLGTVDPTGYRATRAGDTVTLTGRGTAPTPGYRAWLDAVTPEGGLREFVLYWEPPVPAVPAAPTLFRVRITFQAAISVATVTVIDSTGGHVVPIVAASPPVTAAPEHVGAIESALAGLGACHVGTTPTVCGTVRRFRIGPADVDVFSDACGVDVDAPPDVLDRIRATVGSGAKPKL